MRSTLTPFVFPPRPRVVLLGQEQPKSGIFGKVVSVLLVGGLVYFVFWAVGGADTPHAGRRP